MAQQAASAERARGDFRPSNDWLLHAAMLAIVVVAEWIGRVAVPIWTASVVLFPLVWALILGTLVSVLSLRFAPDRAGSVALQHRANAILQVALLVFVAKLGLLVGGALPKLAASGWALGLQEIGHFFGTTLVALPVALLLGIKREAIGATFSIGREPSLAIIAERFGMSSPEGRGVLAEYVTGTVVGALFMALLAGLTASAGWFDARALAMGAGVGSGSMMAAASSAITAAQPPERAAEIATFAAASNLLTTTVGTYFTLFISLPFAQWLYGRLEPVLGRRSAARGDPSVPRDAAIVPVEPKPEPIGWPWGLVSLLLVAAASLVGGHWMTGKLAPPDGIAGLAIILGVVVAGQILHRLVPIPVPIVCWVSVLGMAVTAPFWPGAARAAQITGQIDFLALATPLLAYAGLSIAKDLPVFGQLGWRIVVVSLLANTGTFLGATVLAQAVL